MANQQKKSAPPDLSQLLNQIDQASEHTRGAVGAATQFLKAVQSHLRDKIGDVVDNCFVHLKCYVDDDHGFDPFRVLKWDGKSLVVQTGDSGDPESWFSKPVLELPGKERIECAENLPDLISEIVKESDQLSKSLGDIADQTRTPPPPPPPPSMKRKLPPPPASSSKKSVGGK